ncbi:TetR/AcrR family transcriptional regulator [Peribacillus sp. SCS-37]|uniref:TetR/AcrR family transcriptional regulator n=1 Tax=Paraperibacillus esterisolvens TaxID=3115296 RepID=UPI0039063074
MSKYTDLKKTALALFSEHGYEGTSLNMIAEQTGIRKSSIYAHFNNKDELFMSLIEDISNHYMDVMLDHFKILDKEKSLSVQDKLQITFNVYLGSVKNDLVISRFWKRSVVFPPHHLKDRIKDTRNSLALNSLISKVNSLFIEGICIGEVKDQAVSDLTRSYFCLLEGVIFSLLYNEEVMDFRLPDSMWKHFWSGISDIEMEKEISYERYRTVSFDPLR